jgi:outer membrane immunogenic protein
MKRVVRVGVALAGLFVGSAMAADLPAPVYKGAPPLPAPIFSWTGFYAGVNGGYVWEDAQLTTTAGVCSGCVFSTSLNAQDIAAIDAAGSPRFKQNFGVFGSQTGYNVQRGYIVYGVEFDYDIGRVKNSSQTVTAAYTTPFTAGVLYRVNTAFNSGWLTTTRARLGFTPAPAVLIYATGGLAVGEFTVSNAFNDNFALPNPFFPAIGNSSKGVAKAGWVAGGGVETAVSGNWTARVEYLYLDFSSISTTATITASGSTPSPLTTSAHVKEQMVRLGLNYKFGPIPGSLFAMLQ